MRKNELFVEQYSDTQKGANTYVLFNEDCPAECIIIDIGSYTFFKNLADRFTRATLFITHAHYDHIEGINHFIIDFPNAKVYLSKEADIMIKDPKKNLSYYQGTPISFDGPNLHVIGETEKSLIEINRAIGVFETPGHTKGCLSFKVGDFLFTGDIFIPGIPPVTKLKGGNRDEAKKSMKAIEELLEPNIIICPGHGPVITSQEYFSESYNLDWILRH